MGRKWATLSVRGFVLWTSLLSGLAHAGEWIGIAPNDLPPPVGAATMMCLIDTPKPLRGPDLTARLSSDYAKSWRELDTLFRDERITRERNSIVHDILSTTFAEIPTVDPRVKLIKVGLNKFIDISNKMLANAYAKATSDSIVSAGLANPKAAKTFSDIYYSGKSKADIVDDLLREISVREGAAGEYLQKILSEADETQRKAITDAVLTQMARDLAILADITRKNSTEIARLKEENLKAKSQAHRSVKAIQDALSKRTAPSPEPDCDDVPCEIKHMKDVLYYSTQLEETFAMTGSREGAKAMKVVSLVATAVIGFYTPPQGYLVMVNAVLGLRQALGGGGDQSSEMSQLYEQIQQVYVKLSQQLESMRLEFLQGLTTVNANVVAVYELNQARFREDSYSSCMGLVPTSSFPAFDDPLVLGKVADSGFLVLGSTGRYPSVSELNANVRQNRTDLGACFGQLRKLANSVKANNLSGSKASPWLLNPQRPIDPIAPGHDETEEMLLYKEIERARSSLELVTSAQPQRPAYDITDQLPKLLDPDLSLEASIVPAPQPSGTLAPIVLGAAPMSPEFVDRWVGYALGTHYLMELFDDGGKPISLKKLGQLPNTNGKMLLHVSRILLDAAIFQQSLLTGVALVPIAYEVMSRTAGEPASDFREPLLGRLEDLNIGPPNERPQRLIDNTWFRYNFALYAVANAIRRHGSSALAYEFAFSMSQPEYLERVLGPDWIKQWSPQWKEVAKGSVGESRFAWQLTLNGRPIPLPSPTDVAGGHMVPTKELIRLLYLRDRVIAELAGYTLSENSSQRQAFWNALSNGVDFSAPEY